MQDLLDLSKIDEVEKEKADEYGISQKVDRLGITVDVSKISDAL